MVLKVPCNPNHPETLKMIPEQCPCELGLKGMMEQGIVSSLCLVHLLTCNTTRGCDWGKFCFHSPSAFPWSVRFSCAAGACTDSAGVFEPICPGHSGHTSRHGVSCPAQSCLPLTSLPATEKADEKPSTTNTIILGGPQQLKSCILAVSEL